MSAPNETPEEDLRNALQLLYEVIPADDRSRLYLSDGRMRVIRALRKIGNAKDASPAPAA